MTGRLDEKIYASVAVRYLELGYSPLPLPPGAKWEPPKGYTGRKGTMATAEEVAAWSKHRPPDANVALRLPAGVIGIDVDAHKGLAQREAWDKLVAELGLLPEDAPWSSSRDDGVSGIRLFRVPDSFKAAGDFGIAGEVIQWHHRYVVAPPSVVEGRVYKWMNLNGGKLPAAADLPPLPDAWREGITALHASQAGQAGAGGHQAVTRSAGWTAPDIGALVSGGIPPDHPQDDVLRDVVFKLRSQGLDRGTVLGLWLAIVAKTPLARPGEPWTEADFDRQWRGADAKLSVTEWEDPLPVASVLGALPAFPVDTFPEWMAGMIRAEARFRDCPEDVPAFAAEGAVSVGTGRRAWINARGQRVAVNFYGVAGLDSGQRKSGPFDTMASIPIHDAELKLQEDENARAQQEKEEPRQIRLFTTDATPAGLRDLAAANGYRIGYVSSEGGMFEELAGRYNNSVPDLGLILAGWNGEPYCADRATKFVQPMHDPVLTVCLTTQPPYLRQVGANAAFRDRGLLARMMYGFPPDVVGTRRNERTPIPEEIFRAYRENMLALITGLHGFRDLEWHLDNEAYDLFHAAENAMEPKLLRGAEYGGNDGMREWAGKYTAHVLKTAGRIHAAENVNAVFAALGGRFDAPKIISADTMRKALKRCAYYIAHAEYAFGYMRANPDAEGAQDIVEWVRGLDWSADPFAGRHPRYVTKREVVRYVWRYRLDPDGASRTLYLLQKLGWLNVTEGSRGTVQCVLNPKILDTLDRTAISGAEPSRNSLRPGLDTLDRTPGTVETRLDTSSTGLDRTSRSVETVEEPSRDASTRRNTVLPAETAENMRPVESVEESGPVEDAGDTEATESDDVLWVRDAPADLDDPQSWEHQATPSADSAADAPRTERHQPRRPPSRKQRKGKL